MITMRTRCVYDMSNWRSATTPLHCITALHTCTLVHFLIFYFMCRSHKLFSNSREPLFHLEVIRSHSIFHRFYTACYYHIVSTYCLWDILKMFQLSIIDAIFIQFALVIVIFGNLLHLLEPYVPVCIRQGFRYGKFGYNGNACAWVSWIEIPKSYFKHFYISSTFCSFFALCIAMYVYCFNGVTPEWFLGFLNFWCCSERVATGKIIYILKLGFIDLNFILVSRTSTFFALLLLYLQCLRRLYETHCIQVFSPMGKMNISHYIVGHFHYFGAVLAILSRASGFTKCIFTLWK